MSTELTGPPMRNSYNTVHMYTIYEVYLNPFYMLSTPLQNNAKLWVVGGWGGLV